MEKYIHESFRRMIAMVLCLTMLLPMIVVPGAATEATDPTETTAPVEQLSLTENSEFEQTTDPTETSEPEQTADPTETSAPETDPTNAPGATEPESSVPACDCGNTSSDLTAHADGCVRKQYFKDFCDLTAAEIYAQWSTIPTDGQEFILTYLSWTNQTKLEELNNLLSGSGSEPEEPDTSGSASETTEDGTTVSVTGIPAGSKITASEQIADTAKTAIENAVAEREDTSEQLFMLDISLQTTEGVETQPGGTVRVEMEIPGVTLHKYAEVFVLHVDDEGNVETLSAEVTENGGIAFETKGFSTFAGFTVDFEYNGEAFSINGLETILLSELFDALKMPLYVSDVANVVFSDTTLVSVAKQEDGDWLLTSLQAFQTNETLTVTMNDGTVYVINVTDAVTYAKVYLIAENGTEAGAQGLSIEGGNGVINLNLNGSGVASTGDGAASYYEDYRLWVKGPGVVQINLQNYTYDSTTKTSSVNNLVWNLKQIRITDGATVILRLGGSFEGDETITIKATENRPMFNVVDGSLYIRIHDNYSTILPEGSNTGSQDSYFGNNASANEFVELILDGQNKGTTAYTPLIYMHRGVDENGRENLAVEDVIFRNAQHRAVLVQTNNLTRLQFTNCTFENTVRDVNYGGGVIYIDVKTDAASNGTTNAVDVHRFELNNCTFSGNTGVGYGGAILQLGNVHSGLINGCSFLNCKTSGQGGGAISIAGGTGAMTFQNTTFSGCTSKYRGGAVEIRSAETTNDSGYKRWTRMNDISFSSCTFTDCKSTDSHGGAIAVKAQLNSLSVSGCSFSGCTAGINGGAISLDGQDLPDAFGNTGDSNPNWCAALECDTCTRTYSTIGTTMTGSYDWGNKITSTNTIEKKSKIGTVTISNNCTFTNCSCASNGGTIEFAEGCYIENSATISNTTIDGGKAFGGGSAIFLSNCFVMKLNLHDDIIKNCDFTEGGNDVGGTVRTTGNTTVVLDVQGCQFLDNHSYGHAGGLYWNAARTMEGVTCEATVNDCLFDGNSADMYGGALYVESKMTITKCHIKNNTAQIMGGGIAQQVYNNPKVRMLDEGGVTELKLDPDTWIHHNTAALGGGISIRANETDSIEDGKPIAYTVRFELNGAAVYQNTATQHGGGIYFIAETSNDPDKQAEVDKFTKEILINAGTGTAAAVYGNTAAGNGGGIYMESSENTELRVQGGYISTNTAVNGGGIYMTGKNATCYVEGGTIGGEGNDSQGNPLANKAVRAEGATDGGNGGGIAISGGANIEMTGGTISYNTASHDGGGIWLDERKDKDSEGNNITNPVPNTITIKNGNIIYNQAGASGGGISMKFRSVATMTGGKVSYNTAQNNGGGLEIYYYANLTLSGGTIEGNTATTGTGGGISAHWYGTSVITGNSIIKSNRAPISAGGGVFAQKYNITISGGEITGNTAKNGGGICSVSESTANYLTTISGGSIYKNTATNYGGGVCAEGAKVTVSGGSIYENTATEAGGGISLRSGATATVTNDTTNNTAGVITKNTAARGGGVSVESGAELTVTNGYITYNKAVGTCTQTTAKGHNTSLKGTGGGIYVADGAEDDPAKFTLNGTQYAIYGNLADFAADDVFANGDYTKLEVPKKAEMDLAGYGFKPEGWFEDYPTNDSQYEDGLKQAASGSGIKNGTVYRYRNSDYSTRVLISDDVVDSLVNIANKYVCMTLGIPAAIPDTVVIDFGLPVEINVLGNEHMYVTEQTMLMSLGAARPEVDGSDWTEADALDGKKSLYLTYGKAEIVGNIVCYTPSGMEMNNADTFSYAVKYSNAENPGDSDYYFYYANVTVIPATTIYYEDSFVTYKVYDYKTDTEVSDSTDAKYADNKWTATYESLTRTQAQDRPGDGLPAVDADNIYGYDQAYTSMETYSMGSAMKVKVDSDVYAEASFTFSGTGFDVISLTSNTTGTIMANVYDATDFKNNGYGASIVETCMVDTYYGYKQETVDGKTTWVVDTNAYNSLYQVPVIKISGLEYGHYTVIISASYNSASDHNTADAGYDFYLDAIRIYDPANDGADNQVIEDAYVADGEGWPEYFELRNLLISKKTFDSLGKDDSISGVVFIDNTADTNKNTVYSIEDYTNYGPNNEVYLAPGQAIAFKLNITDTTLDAIHIAMKTVGESGRVLVYDAADISKNNLIPEGTISTATDLYYDITALNGKDVVIQNTGSAGGAILSITNVKVTYTQEHKDSLNNSYLLVDQGVAEAATFSLRAVAEEPEDTVPDTTKPEDTVPDTTEPEDTVPDTTEPEDTVPDTTEPEDTVPDTTEPEDTVPDATEPEETVPDVTEPEETEPAEPESFEPEKMEVRLSDSSVKVGSKVLVTVTTSEDVACIAVNGQRITDFTANSRKGTRTWRVRVTPDAVGEYTIGVTAFNAAEQSSETIAKTITVTGQNSSVGDWIKDLISSLFKGWG